MSTQPDPAESGDGPALEPIHVLRPRRTDALAELFREWEEDTGAGYETVALPRPAPGAEDATQELPAVPYGGGPSPAPPAPHGVGFRRTALAVTVTAAAVLGFGGALLLVERDDDAGTGAAREPSVSATPSAPASGAPGGDAPGAGAGCTASFRTVSSWQGGYQGEVTVTGAPASAVEAWTATVVPADGARLTQVWDGTLSTAADGSATVANADWNGSLAPGASVTFGFLAATASDASPSAEVTCAARGES
ncbi:cellulose binding domain-containing protein [Streptomyces sp. FB2]|uniref:cellulose binding domain-containing protein n=1 Tax=Streptomyces sp. FB2 TaxID=2902454 RepID=UPI0027E4AE9A|nr:cellulose binding domain-containing protein [Streptomyces sp. FB2]